jgi:hypothetical protein
MDRLAEAALRARRGGPRARAGAGQGARYVGAGPRFLGAQRCRRCWDRRGLIVESGRPAGARSGHALRGARLGPQGAGLDSPRPCGADRGTAPCSDILSKARASRGSISTPTRATRAQPRRPTDGAAAEVATGLWRACRIVRVCEQTAGVVDDRPAARPRFATAHGTPARPGGAADPVRQRIHRYGRSRRSLSRSRSHRGQYQSRQWRDRPPRSERIVYLARHKENDTPTRSFRSCLQSAVSITVWVPQQR